MKMDRRIRIFFQAIGILLVAAFIWSQTIARYPETHARQMANFTKRDLKALAAAFDAYKSEHARFPVPEPYVMSEKVRVKLGAVPGVTSQIPSAVQTEHTIDVFMPGKSLPFRYALAGNRCVIISAGPDELWNLDPAIIGLDISPESESLMPFTYDPTNGIFSPGDIFVISKP